MDLGVAMSQEVLEHKLEGSDDGKSPELTWNTRRVPTRLEPGWNNRLFVACDGSWVGYFPLSGEVLWNPDDEQAPCSLIFDARRWIPIAPVPAPRFRGWRYLDALALGPVPGQDEPPQRDPSSSSRSSA